MHTSCVAAAASQIIGTQEMCRITYLMFKLIRNLKVHYKPEIEVQDSKYFLYTILIFMKIF